MRLQHYADGKCNLPLWCYYEPDIMNGQAARMFPQECFTGLPPTYRISRIGYQVAATRKSPSNPVVEVRGFDGNAPSADPILPPFSLTDADVSPGYHEVDLDYLLQVESFCIGLAAGDLAMDTGFGLAVDDIPPPGHQSFYRVNGSGGCNTGAAFYDIAAVAVYPKAQWCIDVDIIPL